MLLHLVDTPSLILTSDKDNMRCINIIRRTVDEINGITHKEES